MKTRAPRSGFGYIRQLDSGSWQFSYMHVGRRWNAPDTFETKKEAERYRDKIKNQIATGKWEPPAKQESASKTVVASVGSDPTLYGYAEMWKVRRRVKGRPLAPKTLTTYKGLLEGEIYPHLGRLPLSAITRDVIRTWHKRPDSASNMRAASYSLLKTILGSAAFEDDLIQENPCTVPGAATPPGAKVKDALSADQLMAVIGMINDRYAAQTAILSFCGLRFDEAASTVIADIDLVKRQVHVRKSKTPAGLRTVPIPVRVVPVIKAYLAGRAGTELAFPNRAGLAMLPSSYQKPLTVAARRAEIGRHVHPHLLRHSGATLFSQQPGVTVADVMRWLGHTTPTMAMRYVHSNDDRLGKLAKDM